MRFSQREKPILRASDLLLTSIKQTVTGICFALLFCLPAGAQTNAQFNRVDSLIRTLPADINTAQLVGFVNSSFSSAAKKVRAYYTWIALNIAYDKSLLDQYRFTAALQLQNFTPGGLSQEPDTVFLKRKAVCEGYCKLMNHLCARSGITAIMVPGLTRLPDTGVEEDILHTWNVVLVDSSWQLLDITWAGGYVDAGNRYVRKFSGAFFFTPPAEFVKSHWPLDAMWQLLPQPVTKSAFEEGGVDSESESVFNFMDSIQAYNSLNAFEREYTDYLHYHRYDPGNGIYTQTSDYFLYNRAAMLFNKAGLYFDDYMTYARSLKGKEIGEREVRRCIRLLEEPRRYLDEGLRFSSGRKFFHQDVRKRFGEMEQTAVKRLVEIDEFLSTYREMLKALR